MELNYATLKDRHRETREGFPSEHSLRTHRALSWLQRAERETDDPDARFIFLWIAFNAAYANVIDLSWGFSERRVLLHFLHLLIRVDADDLLYQLVWDEFSGPIRLLIDNRYVHQPFWEFQQGLMGKTTWQREFHQSRQKALKALSRKDTKKVLAVIFDRLYVLRNQLVHGGATWNGKVNRQQVQDGSKLLGRLVPAIIHLMLENPGEAWGSPAYPVVDTGG